MATQLILRADYEGALWYKNGDWYNPYLLICTQNEENEVEIDNLITRIDNWLDFYKAIKSNHLENVNDLTTVFDREGLYIWSALQKYLTSDYEITYGFQFYKLNSNSN